MIPNKYYYLNEKKLMHEFGKNMRGFTLEGHGINKIIKFTKVISNLLICLIVVSGCSTPLEEQLDVFSLRFDPSSNEIEEGEETGVYVWVDEASGLIAARFTVSFDPSIVEVVNIETSGLDFIFTEAGAEVIEIENNFDNESGKIIIGIGAQKDGFQGAQGSGSLALIFFKAKSVGECNLSFINTQPDDIVTTVYSGKSETGWDEIPVNTFTGTITVKEQPEEQSEEQAEKQVEKSE